MYKKLDNDTWEEYLKKFNKVKNTITAKEFCTENNLNKSQFYYYKKRREKAICSKEPIFQDISLNCKINDMEETKIASKEVKITVGSANIFITISEATLIASIIKELILKCSI